jgi:hypothetical protein
MSAKGVVIFVLFIMLLVSVAVLIVLVDQTIFSQPVELVGGSYNAEINVYEDSYRQNINLQFSENMRFNHNTITYQFSPSCTATQVRKMVQAINFIENSTKHINFSLVSWKDHADVTVFCGQEYLETEDLYVAGEGGPSYVINSTLFNTILKGKVVLYKSSCGFNVELHELLHVFG